MNSPSQSYQFQFDETFGLRAMKMRWEWGKWNGFGWAVSSWNEDKIKH